MNKQQYPNLELNEAICRKNISRMVNKAKGHGLVFRPHFKTHQSAEVGNWFKEEGVKTITVSSVAMAHYFAAVGWKDILVAFPVHPAQIGQLNELAEKVQISILVSSKAATTWLGAINKSVFCYVELDFGSDRTGFVPEAIEDIDYAINSIISMGLEFKGFYTHPGHTYSAKGKEEVEKIYGDIYFRYEKLINVLDNFSIDTFICGDTPGSSVIENFGSITGISPGNFVFYDVMQFLAGSCQLENIAVNVKCPVVSKKGSNEIIIHGGAVHFSKDFVNHNGNHVYGRVVDQRSQDNKSKVLSGTYLARLSQEHGVIRSDNEAWYDSIKEGEFVHILPIHSCLTANLFPRYQCGDRIIDKMQSF
ncbi:MAG TPA: alanine racemase [Cytophagales bacterium]|jgi:D-serine deaminase-like pyridoxal phosphate-dependent protein|nr:alanine racemase [Cytophagales bacterium]